MLTKPVGKNVERIPRWPGECVALVAAGASAKAVDLSVLRDRIHVAVVNKSEELCPWGDLLYACDVNFWQASRGATSFQGLKVTQDKLAADMFPELVRIEVNANGNELLLEPFGHVGAGGNSGFQLLNLLVQMGVTGIMLVGCDMTGGHWHGRHLPPMTNPDESNYTRWRGAFNNAGVMLAQMGVDVVNCSQISTISAYPKMSIDDALKRWGL